MVDDVGEDTQFENVSGCLPRMVWMLVGPAVLAVLLLISGTADSAFLSVASIVFWIVVGLTVLARYLDVTRYEGTMGDGETPATLHDVKRYSSWLVVGASAAWVLVHSL